VIAILKQIRMWVTFFLIILGQSFLFYSYKNYETWWNLSQWKAVAGNIVASDDQRQVLLGRDFYRMRVRYSFKMGDETYLGHRLSNNDWLLNWSPTPFWSEQHYPRGKQVSIYVLAQNPRTAVLQLEENLAFYFYIFFGILFLYIGSYYFLRDLWEFVKDVLIAIKVKWLYKSLGEGD
jgi:hypothetical protein